LEYLQTKRELQPSRSPAGAIPDGTRCEEKITVEEEPLMTLKVLLLPAQPPFKEKDIYKRIEKFMPCNAEHPEAWRHGPPPAGARSGMLRKLGRSGLRGQMLEAMKKLKTYL